MKDKLLNLDTDYLEDAIYYNPVTGTFTWKIRPTHHFKAEWMATNWNKRYANKEAGSVNRAGYLSIKIDYVEYRANRLALYITNKKVPYGVVDHINGDKLDNRIVNLRDISQKSNSSNCKLSSANKSGVCGVWFVPRYGYWGAQIGGGADRVPLGNFNDFFEACCARKSAENKHGYPETHGR